MYLEFYGLLKEPFHITPDPEFLYLSPSHKEALGVILFGVENRAGFMMITGGVGLGKTTILRSAMQQFDRERVKTVLVFNPCLSYRELVRFIYEELGLDLPEGEDQFQLIQRLHLALIEEYKKGNNIVLVIDEAQNTPVETLENLRMLSNLETSKDKLLQIILVGQQPELEDLLNSDALRQLKQRIAHRATLVKLTTKESMDYIGHRIDIALGIRAQPFNKSAIKKIVSHCDGVPRCINIVCSNALVSGYGSGQNPIGPKLVLEVIDDLEGRIRRPWKRWVVAPVALLLMAVFLLLYLSGRVFSPREVSGPVVGSQKTVGATFPSAEVQNGKNRKVEAGVAESTARRDPAKPGESSAISAKPPVAAPISTPTPQQPVAPWGAGEPAKTSEAPSTASADKAGSTQKSPLPPSEPESSQTAQPPPPSEKPTPAPMPSAPRTETFSPGMPQGTPEGQGLESKVEPTRPVSPATPSESPSPAREIAPATKPEVIQPQPGSAAAPPTVKGRSPEKKGAPDPNDIIDWLIDKRSKQKGSGAN